MRKREVLKYTAGEKLALGFPILGHPVLLCQPKVSSALPKGSTSTIHPPKKSQMSSRCSPSGCTTSPWGLPAAGGGNEAPEVMGSATQ